MNTNIFTGNKWHYFTFLKIPLTSICLSREQLHFHTCICVKICGNMLFSFKCMKKIWLHTDTQLEKRIILIIAFLDNYEYFPLILHQTNDGFFKVSYNMEFQKCTGELFLCCYTKIC